MSEKQNKKQAVYFTAGIILLLVILIQFGPLLINLFGNVVYTLRGGDTSDTKVEVGNKIFQPPVLIGIPEATVSANITFSGIAPDKNGVIEIYINDEIEEEIEIDDKSEFFVDDIKITKGKNIIKARFLKNNETSAFSDEYIINYISDKPSLEVSSPTDGATFSKADKSIKVTGKTDSDNTVQVNSFRAIVDSDGEFSYMLQLNDGENQITVEARNPAGLTSQKQLKVIYTP